MADGADFDLDKALSEEEKQSLIGHDLDQEAPQKSRLWAKALVVGTTILLGCSIAFYVHMYLNAPSDHACERLNWAWSRCHPPPVRNLTYQGTGPIMEDLEYEWKQYDSDIVPDEYFGPLTKERRALWYAFRERESSLPKDMRFHHAENAPRRFSRVPRSKVAVARQIARRTRLVEALTPKRRSTSGISRR